MAGPPQNADSGSKGADVTTDTNPNYEPPAQWFDRRSHDGGTHAFDCWKWHPECAYLVGENAARAEAQSRTEAVLRMLLDSGDITPISCAAEHCQVLLTAETGAYLHKNRENGKLVLFCEACSMEVQMNHALRLPLVAL